MRRLVAAAAIHLSSRLFDLDVARAGIGADGGTATVDDAADVMTVQAALHGDWLGDIDGAGAGVGVEVEVGVADGEADGTATGADLPISAGLSVGFDVA